MVPRERILFLFAFGANRTRNVVLGLCEAGHAFFTTICAAYSTRTGNTPRCRTHTRAARIYSRGKPLCVCVCVRVREVFFLLLLPFGCFFPP